MSGFVVSDLSVTLGGTEILHSVDADVASGEWVALIGPNGAGKSTLLRSIAGLCSYGGSIAIDGRDVADWSRREIARRIAFVPQAPLLPADMRVRDYVMLGRTPHIGEFAAEGAADFEAVDRAMRRLDLGHLAERRLRTLSGGEQQRAVLARTLAQDAPILLLDEPTNALDIGRQQQVLELVSLLRAQSELTVISAMHDLTLASQYADRLLLLAQGRLVAAGPPHEIATEALVARHYGANVRIVGEGGALAVVPVRRSG